MTSFTYTLLKSWSEMNPKVSPTLLHFSRTFFNEDKKKAAVRQLQGKSAHVCVFEPSASLCPTASPCKQDDITFYFSSFLARYFISISPVITNWQHMLVFSSIIFNIAYREISAKVSLFHWHVRQRRKYSPTRKLATSTMYSSFWETIWNSLFPEPAGVSNLLEYLLDLWKLH